MSSTVPSSLKAGEGGDQVPTLTADQLTEVLGLLPDVDSVELKLSVAETTRRSVIGRLGLDPLTAQIRQIVFFDTPDLTLNHGGIVLRARRIQRKPGDSVVKLRPVQPDQLSASLRRSPDFGVEVDAMPGGFVCSGAMKTEVDDTLLRQVLTGEKPIRRLFTRPQRALFADHAPGDVGLDDLVMLGPINILKLKFSPEGYPRRMVAELWFYPDGSQILELSAKCLPAEAFMAAAETKAYLAKRGVDLAAPQQTKTRAALTFFAAEAAGPPADGA
jgi:hypothetical protein